MGSWQDGRRPLTLAILAMGGEGGGVLSDWIVELARSKGWLAQNTSVAGVAQRTGATVYYVELFPPHLLPTATAESTTDGTHLVRRDEPVMSLFPTPGEVDVVIASELMEAGRSIQRGFVTPDRTTLIASTNRVYSMTERITPGDGRVDSALILDGAQAASKVFVGADFMEIAVAERSVISSALFGALCATGALPFERSDFEEQIRAFGKGVEPGLRTFARAFDVAKAAIDGPAATAYTEEGSGRAPVPVSIGRRPETPEEARSRKDAELVARAIAEPTSLVGPALSSYAGQVTDTVPAPARAMALLGVQRTAIYQSTSYADLYLQRVARVVAVDPDRDGAAALSTEAARGIALWMCYQDTIHVALQKTRLGRLERTRAEARAEQGQLTSVREYLHPQLEEVTDTMPAGLGRVLRRSRLFGALVDRIAGRGMVVNTTSFWGYTTLSLLARLRPMRPRTLRFRHEQALIDAWLDRIVATVPVDADLATEMARAQRVIKGYGETHAHGMESFRAIIGAAQRLAGQPDAAPTVARLIEAALADEHWTAFDAALLSKGLPDRLALQATEVLQPTTVT